ncbi:MAG TPA: type II toxin-antitoxin system prevent-host-death family antitoxin [Bryobacteraceae bacterium]|jgi:prevent-host-death family protein
MVFTLEEAESRLGKLLDLARSGEEVVITRDGKTVAKLVAAGQESGKLRLGAMKGEFSYKEGWDKPLTDEEADAFWEGRW